MIKKETLKRMAESRTVSLIEDSEGRVIGNSQALARECLRFLEVLEWYGYKMVPESLNEGRTEITTELGKRARQALESDF